MEKRFDVYNGDYGMPITSVLGLGLIVYVKNAYKIAYMWSK